MSTTHSVIFEDRLEIPLGLGSLAEFRRWALSDSFPETGRIDYIDGRIEVDMSPEDLFCHGTLKIELVRVLATLVDKSSSGYLFSDSTRVSSPRAQLSVEPDVVYVSEKSLESGRTTMVPKASKMAGRYVEIEGAVDAVIEIVSDSSVSKDRKRLPRAYFAAGIKEFWLIDARRESLLFKMYRRGKTAFVGIEPDADGYWVSNVFGKRFRLERTRNARGFWTFKLRVR